MKTQSAARLKHDLRFCVPINRQTDYMTASAPSDLSRVGLRFDKKPRDVVKET
jgi:hypothetical protein